MRKIPTLFVRRRPETGGPRRACVVPEVTPGCAWVAEGHGTATRKWDGTCVRRDAGGLWWARREVKAGREPPADFLAEEYDDATGKTVGWEPIERSPFVRPFREALGDPTTPWEPGTYELLGPKLNGNPDGFPHHTLIRHGWMSSEDHAEASSAPRDFDGLWTFLTSRDWEGIVWHNPDGRRVKLKRRDFPS